MRYSLSIFVLFIAAAAAIAQSPAKAENWRQFSPAWEEFSVETPVGLTQDGANAPEISRKFSAVLKGTYVFIFSDPLKNQSGDGPRYFPRIREAIAQISQSSEMITADGQMMNTITFKDKFGYFHNVATLRTANRSYIAQTVSLDEKSEIASHFIKSFTANTPAAEQQQSSVDETSALPLGRSDVEPARGFGTGSSSTAALPALAAQPVASSSSTQSKLRVLSKPRPTYTDLARIYGIQGTIILQVQFLSTGEIGAIKAVSELPFGLTASAIAASKEIKFEPAVEDGSPVTVTKSLEYSYAIY